MDRKLKGAKHQALSNPAAAAANGPAKRGGKGGAADQDGKAPEHAGGRGGQQQKRTGAGAGAGAGARHTGNKQGRGKQAAAAAAVADSKFDDSEDEEDGGEDTVEVEAEEERDDSDSESSDDDEQEEDDELEVVQAIKKRRAQAAAAGTTGGAAAGEPDESIVVPKPPASYINKQRVMVFCTRGTVSRYRHLMEDVRNMLPHHKKESKLDAKDNFYVINEIAEMKTCNSCVFFESRRKNDLYLWLSKTPNGPSVKFLLLNVHTMDELRMTGNCLRGSRPFLSFDAVFEQQTHLRLLKEMFIQIFGTPKGHPKSQPFHDHVISFSVVDNKIWFRHYQIMDTATDKKAEKRVLHEGHDPTTLVEIGPRFVLDVVRIFAGSFGGPTLYQNPNFVSPNAVRHDARMHTATKFANRKEAAKNRRKRARDIVLPMDELDGVFQ